MEDASAASPTGAALSLFSTATQNWFTGAFDQATQAQTGAWAAIAAGNDTLVVAPTGSGKTLAAFLWALDRLAVDGPPADAKQRCRVLYVSPLKALAVDVERNLRSPLIGIQQAAVRAGVAPPDIRVGVRSGDTPADERRRFGRIPPDVLITTPESLFLILTSQAREALRGVHTVIIDEVHAVAGTKRGAHLAFSLERLDALLPQRAQRIGLSATVHPVGEVARFLSGGGAPTPTTIVAPKNSKEFDLRIVVPVEDMSVLGGAGLSAQQPAGTGQSSTGGTVSPDNTGSAQVLQPSGTPQATASLWPHVEERIVDLVSAHTSTLVFANSRRLAERLTARLNEISDERAGNELPAAGVLAPAQVMAQSGTSRGSVGPVLARAHHGSVSKEQRSIVEEELKSGRLPAVVATSSLELGIDMGAIDLVVQVEAPPSVASGLQRVGRAGHQVGAVSRGIFFPKYRGDLLTTTVVVQRMLTGDIEALRVPRNPLDVLAQQCVAMMAMDAWTVDDLLELTRRVYPFASLTPAVFESVLDMLAGRYPAEEFAELRPRLVWDRVDGVLTGRPGAQRLAVTSGGTIPDRGLFGVFTPAGETGGTGAQGGRRVGELDEEMVYESRVGDVFTLGTSSWRIEDITHDRVVVTPAPGQPGRLPFWKGDVQSRPLELGRALGAFTRGIATATPGAARDTLRTAGLDEWAVDNLQAYIGEQVQATGQVPTDQTLVVERFRDELGDWRLVVHSPFGSAVHAPWALAVGARLRERYGVQAQGMHSDDGMVFRIPDTESMPPGADLILLEADEVEDLVTAEVGGSALFASRFRECAARALLLPRRDPGRRSPLWQQRQRSAALLEVAAGYSTFPIVLETMREVLQDVYDLTGLIAITADIAARRIRVVEVETSAPSPFARSLLFGYVASFLYEGDAPLAERRAAALSLDSTLLAELLGRTDLRELLDPQVLLDLEDELQRLTPTRRARNAEGVADLLRQLGPLSDEALRARSVEGTPDGTPDGSPDGSPINGGPSEWAQALQTQRRVIRVRIAGQDRWAAIEDSGRLRDALGVALPVGVPEAFTEVTSSAVTDLIARYARTHGPFTTGDIAAHFGLGVAVVNDALQSLVGVGKVVEGEFTPGSSGTQWCDAAVLRTFRRRSLAALRHEVEPVEPAALTKFLPAWQHVGSSLTGPDGVLRVVEQLAGCQVPASALERLVLPARIRDYNPAWLDELTTAGEVLWAGHASLPGSDGWVSLHPADSADRTMALPDDLTLTALATRALTLLTSSGFAGSGGFFFRQIIQALAESHGEAGLSDKQNGTHPDDTAPDDSAVVAALWELVWAGYLTNDTFAPVRSLVAGGGAHKARTPTPRLRYGRATRLPGSASRGLARIGPPIASGRWSLLPPRETNPTRRAQAAAELLLDRHGVLTRGAVNVEGITGGFATIYKVLSAFEESGRCRRGYFVAGLGAAQFASAGAVDRLRGPESSPQIDQVSWAAPQSQGAGGSAAPTSSAKALLLAATDPANPFGAALPWPTREEPGGHRPGRKAGALVCIVEGDLVLYVEKGGRSLLSYTEDPTSLAPAAQALAAAVRAGALGKLALERADGTAVLRSPLGHVLADAGFHVTPKGLRLRS